MSTEQKPRRRTLRLWIVLMALAVIAGLGLAARGAMLEGNANGERLLFDTAPLLSVQLGDGSAAVPAEIEIIRAQYVNGDRSIGYRLDLTTKKTQERTGCTGRLETLLSASQAELIRGILLAGYPGSTLEQLRRSLRKPALSENDAIIATQLAIWQARYGLEFRQTDRLSTAARALLENLIQAKPIQPSPWALECEPSALIVSNPAQVTGPIRVINRKNVGGQLTLALETRTAGAYFALPKEGGEPDAYVRAGDVLEGVDAGEYYLQLPRNGDGRLNLWIHAKDRLPMREDIGYIDADLGRLAIWANEGVMVPSMRAQVNWGEVSAPTAEVLANPMPLEPAPASDGDNPFTAASGTTLGTPIDPHTGTAAAEADGGSETAGGAGTTGGSDATDGSGTTGESGGSGATGGFESTAMPGAPIWTSPPGIPIPNPNGTQVPSDTQAPGESPNDPAKNAGDAGAETPNMEAAPVNTRHRTAKPMDAQETEPPDETPAPSSTPNPKANAPEVDAIAAPGHLRLRYLSNALIVLRRESITVEPAWEDIVDGTELPSTASLEWSSSDPKVASLYVNDGLCTIEARDLGECTVTLSVRGRPDVSTQIRLTVAEPVRETSEAAAKTLRLRAPGFTGEAEVRFEEME